MPIIWKPTGSLNINTDPTELPEQNDGKSIASGAMTRCKNLRLNRNGIAITRYGTTQLSSFVASATPDLLIEAGGHRYIFAGDYIYYDETETSSTTYIAAPTFSPVAGIYLSEQTVTISSATTGIRIHYTLDGEDPTEGSPVYSTPILVPGKSWLKAFAIDPNGRIADSAITTGYYGLWAQDTIITETDGDTLITETDSDTLTTEGP